MDHQASIDLLESTHSFPGVVPIKAIGSNENDFASRVIAAAAEELASPGEIESQVRATPGGRHVSVTLHVSVQTPQQVLAIYARIREVEGLTLLF